MTVIKEIMDWIDRDKLKPLRYDLKRCKVNPVENITEQEGIEAIITEIEQIKSKIIELAKKELEELNKYTNDRDYGVFCYGKECEKDLEEVVKDG